MGLVKRATIAIVCFIFFFTACFFSAEEPKTQSVSVGVGKIKKVIIDAGHGGFDGGAVADDGTPEKDINLEIAKKLAAILRFNGYTVIMTRTEDTATNTEEGSIASRKKSDMRERLRIINENPDAIFVSVHLNKFTTSSARGTQVFYSPNTLESKDLGQSIQTSVKNLLQPENTRTIKQGTKSTYLLHNAKIPAVIVECGFLSNPVEFEKLKNDEYRSQMAFSIFVGIEEFN